MYKFSILLLLGMLVSCNTEESGNQNIVTSDINNFWEAYDQIIAIDDTIAQVQLIQDLYISKGTAGLKAIMDVRNYTANEYVQVIHDYPKFWSGIRANTLKCDEYATEMNQGIEKIRAIYPALKPAKIYFTIGAFRTNGTYKDSLVLIGSELAMADENIDSSEFPDATRAGRRQYFDSNPIDGLVLLNIHEYVHTQQNPVVHNLLSYCLHEGVAEFVSVTAMGLPSNAPAIQYGKQNDNVRKKFEQEMFFGYNVGQWLWSDGPNEFGVRDLGYHIGYELCERYYNQAKNKQEAIKKMIELDYTNEDEIEAFIDGTGYFSESIEKLYQNYEAQRPTIVNIQGFENNSTISPKTKKMTFEFSEALNGYNTGIDYGPLGEEYFPEISFDRIWSNDNKSWTIQLDLEPNKHYQFLVSNNFRKEDGVNLKPLVVEFKTSK